jgi:hypothetical protein
VLSVGPGRLDSAEFERLTGAGQAALEAGVVAVAADRFGDALGLWPGVGRRGRGGSAGAEGRRLDGLRLAALEGRIEADLALDRHGELPAELERLVAEHLVRERFWCQLVLALCRAGRQAGALAACRRARVMLAEELCVSRSDLVLLRLVSKSVSPPAVC